MTIREREEIEQAELGTEGLTPQERTLLWIRHARGRGPKSDLFIRETYTEMRGDAAFLRQQSASKPHDNNG